MKPNTLLAEYKKSLYKANDFPVQLVKRSSALFGAAYNMLEPYISMEQYATKEEPEDIDLEDEDKLRYIDKLKKFLSAMGNKNSEHSEPIHLPSHKQSIDEPR